MWFFTSYSRNKRESTGNTNQVFSMCFFAVQIFFNFFSESATNSCHVGSYCAERGSEGKQPSPTLTQKGGESA
ncbi:hypothetical protein ERM36_00350 [Clostridioides difficile]|nr:hypothetical protein [Clostridioides difficile]